MKLIERITKITLVRQFLRYKKGTEIFAIVLSFVIVISTIVLFFAESSANDKINALDVLWTTLFTIVGAADFADKPSSHIGRTIIFILSMCGIGIVGWIISELAGNFVLNKLKEGLGMGESKFKNHFIICGWNSHARIVIEEFSKCKKPLVLISDIDNPLTEYEGHHYFIHGDCRDKETLMRAGIDSADVAIILADKLGIENKSIDDIDAKTILTALMIKKICKGKKDITTIVELLNPKNKHFADDADADDIILYNDFAAKLFATCVLNKGMSKVFADLLSFEEGPDFFTAKVPSRLIGKNFSDVVTYYSDKMAMPIAVFNGDKPLINPPRDTKITESDRIVYISKVKLSDIV